jgi:hypothetical protein
MTDDLTPTTLTNDSNWPRNYFNYFTEIEEHFRQARGTGLFLLSPLDWALIENWKNSGIPLEAVLKGIDEAFEKSRSRKTSRRLVNSLAYCAQAVLEAAQRVPEGRSRPAVSEIPFGGDEIRNHLNKTAIALRQRPESPFQEIASSLETLSGEIENLLHDLEGLERRLTALEEKMVAALRAMQRDEDLLSIRESLDRELKPYRGKMTADQLAMLERRYLDSALLERAKLPRLSLFYLH